MLHRHPAQPWTIADLAREVGLSRSVLAERFRHLSRRATPHVELRMIGQQFSGDPQYFIRGLRNVRDSVSQSTEASEFLQAPSALVAAQSRLRAELP